MIKALLTASLFCAATLYAAAQPLITVPTLRDDNLKGPVHIVQTTVSDDPMAFYRRKTKAYDTAGRLTYCIEQIPQIPGNIFTYEYNQEGGLAKVCSKSHEVYTNTYHYDAIRQLDSIVTRWAENFEIYNDTLQQPDLSIHHVLRWNRIL